MALKEAYTWVIHQISLFLNQIYLSFSTVIPAKYHAIINLFVYALLIALYGVFVWNFYKFLAKKDIVKLDFSRYAWSNHPFLNKISATFFFLLENIIIIPFLVTFWFSVLSFFLFVLSANHSVQTIAVIAAVIITSTRILSYYSYDLSKEIAKIFPLTLLAIFLMEPNFFSFTELIERASELPSLVDNIMGYLVFIIILELVLKSISAFLNLTSISSDEDFEDTTTVKELSKNKDSKNSKPIIVKKDEVFDYKPSEGVNKGNKYLSPPQKTKKK